jgi:competence protein ComEC
MQWVLETFAVGTYIDSGATAETTMWGKLDKLRKKLTKQGKLQYVNGRMAKSVDLPVCASSSVSLEVFSPWAFSKRLTDANDRSIVARLGHKGVSFLFVGDAHDTAEKVMLEQIDEELRKKLDVDVLKVGHHGSHTSSLSAFVLAVSPQMAVISSGQKDVGTNVRYKHPRHTTIVNYANWFKTADRSRYGSVELPGGNVWAYDKDRNWRQITRPDGLWLTTVDGTVVVRSDGSKLDVSTH